jgi:hypothetical protein
MLRFTVPAPTSMPALTQLAHGFSLLHLTFLLRHVTHDRGLRWEVGVEVELERTGWEEAAGSRLADGEGLMGLPVEDVEESPPTAV